MPAYSVYKVTGREWLASFAQRDDALEFARSMSVSSGGCDFLVEYVSEREAVAVAVVRERQIIFAQ